MTSQILFLFNSQIFVNAHPVSILYKSVAGRYRPVRVADGPITVRYRFINIYMHVSSLGNSLFSVGLNIFYFSKYYKTFNIVAHKK